MNINKIISTIFYLIIFTGLNSFSGADSLNDSERDFVRGRLSQVREELDIAVQGFGHYCDSFKNSNRGVAREVLEFIVEDTRSFASTKLLDAFSAINRILTQELEKQKVDRKIFRTNLVKTKRNFFSGLEEIREPGLLKQLYSASSDVGFEAGVVRSFMETLRGYKESSLELCGETLDEIFQSLSPSAPALKKTEIKGSFEEPAEPAYAARKKKKKKKKKPSSASVAPLSDESLTPPLSSSTAVVAAPESDLEEDKDDLLESLVREEENEGEKEVASASAVDRAPTLFKKEVPYEMAEKKGPSRVKEPRALEDTFHAIWYADLGVDPKAFVKFWEHFGFVNTQRPALGNGFFILQHKNGYKLKTSHVPHSKDEKVFSMVLAFAKSLLGSADIKGVHDKDWQQKLTAFLCKPCRGMRI
jgi:hypothetical protein